MRVLVVTAAYPSDSEPTRAAFLENLHRALIDVSGGECAIRVVAPRVHEADPLDEMRHGIAIERFAYGARGQRLKQRASPWRRLRFFAAARSRIAGAIARERQDLIVGHWLVPTASVAAPIAAKTRTPLIGYAHGSDVHTYGQRRLGRAMVRGVLRRAARIVAVSSELRDRLRALDPAVAVDVLPMGIAPIFHADLDAAAIDERRELELLYVGDVSEAKGAADLFRALVAVRGAGVDARLHIIGGGDIAMPSAASSLPEGTVVRHGISSPGDVARWCSRADLFVHASHREGAPVAIMEALARGLPVVATRVGGVPEIVDDGSTGVLVPPADPAALGAAIVALARRRGAIDELRANIRSHPRDDSSASRATRLLEIFREVLH